MPKVFLSFATEDLDFIIKFFSRLKRLGVNIWDYSNRDEEIGLGNKILDVLKDRILESDYFIPVISCNSVMEQKLCIQYEVRIAAESHKKCFPVIISGRRPIQWSGAFELISDRKYLEIDHENSADFEEKICELCASLKVIYQPDFLDNNRLPLYKNLQKEINSQLNEINKLGKRYLYEKMMSIVNQFNLFYAVGKWKESLDKIKYFLAFSAEEMKNIEFYYPVIAQGACELQLDLITDAEGTFNKGINHTYADENAFGGLGQVYLRQNKFGEALKQFNVALSKCPVGMDTEIIYNILLTAFEILSSDEKDIDKDLIAEAIRIINNAEYMSKLDTKSYSNNKERIRIKYLIGLALYKCNSYRKSYDYFINIFENEAFSISVDLFFKELESGIVSSNLHWEFKRHGFFIPVGRLIQRFSVINDLPSSKITWIIVDGESIYEIHNIQCSLQVYYKEMSLIIYFSQLLECLNQKENALKLLREEAVLLNNKMLFHYYANLLSRQGYIKQASDIYKEHLCEEPYDKQFLIEYALILKSQKELSVMKKKCEQVISLGMPKDRRECYYHGFGYFLLGRNQEAHAYYADSMAYAEFYKNIIAAGN